MRMGSDLPAWKKVFLRNGLIWTAYLSAWGFVAGMFHRPGWPLGFSDTVNTMLTYAVLIPTWIVMAGGGICLYRRILAWQLDQAKRSGKTLGIQGPRWFLSYFLEIDENGQPRP